MASELVASELVTSARKCASGPAAIEQRVSVHAVHIVVRDSEPTVPEARSADPRTGPDTPPPA